MKAAWYEQFGAPDDVLTVGELEDPKPGPGEVLVRLKASSVNPSDVKKRAGSFPNLLDDGYVIPHSDGAGVIESVGEGVSGDRVGDEVWVYQAQYGRRFGTAAELVTVGNERAPLLPEVSVVCRRSRWRRRWPWSRARGGALPRPRARCWRRGAAPYHPSCRWRR